MMKCSKYCLLKLSVVLHHKGHCIVDEVGMGGGGLWGDSVLVFSISKGLDK